MPSVMAVLHLHQGEVETTSFDQLVVSALLKKATQEMRSTATCIAYLRHFAVFHYANDIGIPYRAQSMRDDYNGTILHDAVQCIFHLNQPLLTEHEVANRSLALCIESGSRLVQYEYRWVLQKGAGNRNSLNTAVVVEEQSNTSG